MMHVHRSHGRGLHYEAAALSACLARLLCAVAVAIALWMSQRAGQPIAPSRDLAAGIVGMMIVAVLLLLPMRARFQAPCWEWLNADRDADRAADAWATNVTPEAKTLCVGMHQRMAWAAGPVLLLLGALAAMALTGGWESPLALLLLLPALALDTAVGDRGVLILAGAIWLAALANAFVLGNLTVTRGQLLAGILAPAAWAIVGALVYWIRVLLVERHITMRNAHATAEALRQETEAMYRSRRDLLAHVSHELLTPLAAIQSGAGMLGDPAAIHEPNGASLTDSINGLEAGVTRRIARNVQRNALRLTLLVDDVLELARIDEARTPLAPARHTCSDTLRNATEAVALLCEGQNQLTEWSAIPADLTYWGDARRVDQVLVNLLANANKYAGSGATITLFASAWAGGVRWEVRDDGPRLGDETLRHLFERYYRAPNLSIVGNGLGLSIARALVELHRGRIWAENNAGPGCRFIFWLPDSKWNRAYIEARDVAWEGEQR